MDRPPGRHFREDVDVDERTSLRVIIARGLLLSGRILPVATIAAVTFSHLTRASWEGASLDQAGFTTAWVPNVAATLSGVLGFALPFIVLPVGSSALAERDGNRLTVRTVLGTRIIDLPTARVWRAWLPGKGPDTQVVLVRSRLGWAILTASESWLPRTDALLATGVAEPGIKPGWVLYVHGWVLILLWVVVAIACLGTGFTIAGLA